MFVETSLKPGLELTERVWNLAQNSRKEYGTWLRTHGKSMKPGLELTERVWNQA